MGPKKPNKKRRKKLDDSDSKSKILSDCNLCGQSLNNISQTSHEENYHQDGRHICLTCKKEFVDIKLLKRHVRIHL